MSPQHTTLSDNMIAFIGLIPILIMVLWFTRTSPLELFCNLQTAYSFFMSLVMCIGNYYKYYAYTFGLFAAFKIVWKNDATQNLNFIELSHELIELLRNACILSGQVLYCIRNDVFCIAQSFYFRMKEEDGFLPRSKVEADKEKTWRGHQKDLDGVKKTYEKKETLLNNTIRGLNSARGEERTTVQRQIDKLKFNIEGLNGQISRLEREKEDAKVVYSCCALCDTTKYIGEDSSPNLIEPSSHEGYVSGESLDAAVKAAEQMVRSESTEALRKELAKVVALEDEKETLMAEKKALEDEKQISIQSHATLTQSAAELNRLLEVEREKVEILKAEKETLRGNAETRITKKNQKIAIKEAEIITRAEEIRNWKKIYDKNREIITNQRKVKTVLIKAIKPKLRVIIEKLTGHRWRTRLGRRIQDSKKTRTVCLPITPDQQANSASPPPRSYPPSIAPGQDPSTQDQVQQQQLSPNTCLPSSESDITSAGTELPLSVPESISTGSIATPSMSSDSPDTPTSTDLLVTPPSDPQPSSHSEQSGSFGATKASGLSLSDDTNVVITSQPSPKPTPPQTTPVSIQTAEAPAVTLMSSGGGNRGFTLGHGLTKNFGFFLSMSPAEARARVSTVPSPTPTAGLLSAWRQRPQSVRRSETNPQDLSEPSPQPPLLSPQTPANVSQPPLADSQDAPCGAEDTPMDAQTTPMDPHMGPTGDQTTPTDTQASAADTQDAPIDTESPPTESQAFAAERQDTQMETQRTLMDAQITQTELEASPAATQATPTSAQAGQIGPDAAPTNSQPALRKTQAPKPVRPLMVSRKNALEGATANKASEIIATWMEELNWMIKYCWLSTGPTPEEEKELQSRFRQIGKWMSMTWDGRSREQIFRETCLSLVAEFYWFYLLKKHEAGQNCEGQLRIVSTLVGWNNERIQRGPGGFDLNEAARVVNGIEVTDQVSPLDVWNEVSSFIRGSLWPTFHFWTTTGTRTAQQIASFTTTVNHIVLWLDNTDVQDQHKDAFLQLGQGLVRFANDLGRFIAAHPRVSPQGQPYNDPLFGLDLFVHTIQRAEADRLARAGNSILAPQPL